MYFYDIQKEIGDRFSASIDQIQQLLPLAKIQYEVIVTEPYSERGHKSSEAPDRRQVC